MPDASRPFDQQTLAAQAVDTFSKTRKIPDDFYEGRDGIVRPERERIPAAEIAITGRVGEDMFRDVCASLSRVTQLPGPKTKLDVSFASPGGDVSYGFGIHDKLATYAKEHNLTLVITGFGPVMSMGALIIQAADVRRMPKHSRLLLHPFQTGISGPSEFGLSMIDETRRATHTYARIVSDRANRTGRVTLTPEQVLEMMNANANAGTYFTADEAWASGLIDEVV